MTFFIVNALQNPPAVHICCTRLTIPAVDTFLSDLKEAVDEVRIMPDGTHEGSMVQIYGLGKSNVSGPFIVSEFAKLYLDVLYEL
jgi:sphinganine-1-phosphate aldolase